MSRPNLIPSGINPQEKGRAPEGCGQKEITMLKVADRPPVSQASEPVFSISSTSKKLGIWLDSLVEKAKVRPVSQIVQITPDLAEVLLNRNPENRKISTNLVENYAHEIANGRWAFNGEPIIISDTGELNDGQHRCAAVVAAKRSIDVVMIIGVKRQTRTTLDQGKARTVGDYLSMEGNTYSNILGSSAGYVWLYRNRGHIAGGGGRGSRATKGEIMETVADNPGLKRSVVTVYQKAADAVGGKSVLAFAHFVLSAINREDADHFIHSLMFGAGLKAGDPVLYVRNRLINERGAFRPNEKAELIFKGWNAWRKGERVSRLLISGGVLPVLEN